MVIVTSLNNSEKQAKKIAKSINAKYSKTLVDKFPDEEIYIKYNTELKGKKLIIVESLQPNPNKSLLNVIFAAKAAKMQGAKKVILRITPSFFGRILLAMLNCLFLHALPAINLKPKQKYQNTL